MFGHSPPSTYQIILSTAHPAKFSGAVATALHSLPQFDFERDVLPNEFRGLLEKERKVFDIPEPNAELVKQFIDRVAA